MKQGLMLFKRTTFFFFLVRAETIGRPDRRTHPASRLESLPLRLTLQTQDLVGKFILHTRLLLQDEKQRR